MVTIFPINDPEAHKPVSYKVAYRAERYHMLRFFQSSCISRPIWLKIYRDCALMSPHICLQALFILTSLLSILTILVFPSHWFCKKPSRRKYCGCPFEGQLALVYSIPIASINFWNRLISHSVLGVGSTCLLPCIFHGPQEGIKSFSCVHITISSDVAHCCIISLCSCANTAYCSSDRWFSHFSKTVSTREVIPRCISHVLSIDCFTDQIAITVFCHPYVSNCKRLFIKKWLPT